MGDENVSGLHSTFNMQFDSVELQGAVEELPATPVGSQNRRHFHSHMSICYGEHKNPITIS